jgi:hypothetical protein
MSGRPTSAAGVASWRRWLARWRGSASGQADEPASQSVKALTPVDVAKLVALTPTPAPDPIDVAIQRWRRVQLADHPHASWQDLIATLTHLNRILRLRIKAREEELAKLEQRRRAQP